MTAGLEGEPPRAGWSAGLVSQDVPPLRKEALGLLPDRQMPDVVQVHRHELVRYGQLGLLWACANTLVMKEHNPAPAPEFRDPARVECAALEEACGARLPSSDDVNAAG